MVKNEADNEVIEELIIELKNRKSRFLNILISLDKKILEANYSLD